MSKSYSELRKRMSHASQERAKAKTREVLATLEILADQNLTARLMNLSKLSEDELINGGLLSHEEVFGKP